MRMCARIYEGVPSMYLVSSNFTLTPSVLRYIFVVSELDISNDEGSSFADSRIVCVHIHMHIIYFMKGRLASLCAQSAAQAVHGSWRGLGLSSHRDYNMYEYLHPRIERVWAGQSLDDSVFRLYFVKEFDIAFEIQHTVYLIDNIHRFIELFLLPPSRHSPISKIVCVYAYMKNTPDRLYDPMFVLGIQGEVVLLMLHLTAHVGVMRNKDDLVRKMMGVVQSPFRFDAFWFPLR
ncbi:hypothetical protein BDN70DRAFT_901649 [Pholiota conissans]|uniref:Uncharacterized protein n=1 Tax=Pholiota conissans TaxID=109636 RepID=A0A9P6CSZ7_9AGAR|nr:hypothetical protein BDN70DRAFT_901649 [Pholiota conissans]